MRCSEGISGPTVASDAKGAGAGVGASRAIGRNVTERLAADGHFVCPGARKDADLQALGAIDNVQP